MLSTLLLTVGLWSCNARAVCDQQVHHCVASHIHSGCSHHVAEGDRATSNHVRGGGARGGLAVAVGAHVPLKLRGCLAVDATQVADEHTSGACAPKASWAVLPLLAMVLLGMYAKVRQRGET